MPRDTSQPKSLEERSPIARAYAAVSNVVSVAIGMILPGFAGYWADRRLETFPWLTLLGFVFGLSYGFWRITHLTVRRNGSPQD